MRVYARAWNPERRQTRRKGAEGEDNGDRHGTPVRRSAAAPPRLGQRHPGRPGRQDGAHAPGHWPPRAREAAAAARLHRAEAGRGAATGGARSRRVRGGGPAALRWPRRCRAHPSRPSRVPDAAHRARRRGGGHCGPPASRRRAASDPDGSWRRGQDPAGRGGGRARRAGFRRRCRLRSLGAACRIRISSPRSSPRRSGSKMRRARR